MRLKKNCLFGWPLILLLLLLTGCRLQEAYSGKIILDGKHALRAEQTLDGDLVLLGGEMRLHPGSAVTGNVHILGGRIEMGGEIRGNVTQLEGSLMLMPGATIQGSLNLGGGAANGVDAAITSARIRGPVTRSASTETGARLTPVTSPQAGRLITIFIELFVLVLFADLCERYFPRQVDCMGQTIRRYGLLCAALGGLGWVVGLSVMVLMAYTILLIPVSLLGLFLLLLATTAGAVPYARWLGFRINRVTSGKMGSRRRTALGMLVLILLVEGFRLVPVVGTVLGILMFVSALGAAMLTRFGMHPFVELPL